jgi:hypothetical protein
VKFSIDTNRRHTVGQIRKFLAERIFIDPAYFRLCAIDPTGFRESRVLKEDSDYLGTLPIHSLTGIV